MDYPFENKKNSLHNQHFIQLELEKLCLEYTFDVIVEEAMVVRINPNKRVRFHHIESWVTKKKNKIIERIQQVANSDDIVI